MATPSVRNKLEVAGPVSVAYREILSPEALEFLAQLSQQFEGRRLELLERRQVRQAELDSGTLPDFLTETASVRQGDWTVAPIPKDLVDRRVEITGPVDRKMIINALNSGASVFMADFEDSNSPTWQNNMEGQSNLRDTVNGTITFSSPEGKQYRLNERIATLLVRPRGWHLVEKHVLVDGKPISGSLFDFGLYFFHNARNLIAKGSRTVLLPAEAREPSGSAALERRISLCAGLCQGSARHDPRNGADRNDSRRVRDG